MNDTTKRLSGPAKDRFLERFFATEPDIDPALANRLAARSKAAFSILRVRRLAFGRTNLRRPTRIAAPPQDPAVEATLPQAHGTPSPQPIAEMDRPTVSDFDPFVFGLVPVYQREGRDGLLAKLAEIGGVDHLRRMAGAQQIVLPQSLRTGNADAGEIRNAIADAVARRVADRRAAAG
jgi:hypothetical protein